MVSDAIIALVDDPSMVARASTGRRTANGIALVGPEHVDVWTREPGGTWKGDRYDAEFLEVPVDDVGRLSSHADHGDLARIMLERFRAGDIAAA